MLAAALAEEGKRVLLCDMDFRNPSLGKYLGGRQTASSKHGLGER
jgi:Mrp family chromosome partitioning ATPase